MHDIYDILDIFFLFSWQNMTQAWILSSHDGRQKYQPMGFFQVEASQLENRTGLQLPGRPWLWLMPVIWLCAAWLPWRQFQGTIALGFDLEKGWQTRDPWCRMYFGTRCLRPSSRNFSTREITLFPRRRRDVTKRSPRSGKCVCFDSWAAVVSCGRFILRVFWLILRNKVQGRARRARVVLLVVEVSVLKLTADASCMRSHFFTTLHFNIIIFFLLKRIWLESFTVLQIYKYFWGDTLFPS